MAVMASDGPSLLPKPQLLGLAAHQPLRRHHTQSLLGPSFHDPRTMPERCHAISSHSVLALRLHCVAVYNTSSSCRFWITVINHLSTCLNSFTPFPFLAPWPSRPQAIQTLPRSVPVGPLISGPKNVSCSRIPPQASLASLPPRR